MPAGLGFVQGEARTAMQHSCKNELFGAPVSVLKQFFLWCCLVRSYLLKKVRPMSPVRTSEGPCPVPCSSRCSGICMLEEPCGLIESTHVFFQGISCLQSLTIPRELLLSREGRGRARGEM